MPQRSMPRTVVYWAGAVALAASLVMGIATTTLWLSGTVASAEEAADTSKRTAANLEKLSGLVLETKKEQARHRAAAQRNADMRKFCVREKISADRCPQEQL